jgi:hypothetical protein
MLAEILDNTTNLAVLQIPGRNYPGIVVQGDTLRWFRIMAESNDPIQKEELKELLARLENHYVEVCNRPRPAACE